MAAAIGVLRSYAGRPAPISLLMKEWERSARYAGARDRAFVRGLALDTLRHWQSHRGPESARLAVALTLKRVWGWDDRRIADAFAGEHGDGALSDEEQQACPADALDLPSFLIDRIPDPERVAQAMAGRAPVDLRVNTLKTDRPKALKALAALGAEPSPLSPVGLRIAATPAAEKGPGVTVIPAYGKGWVEVQDEGSQLTVLAAGDLHGRQVLDFCAGGGGKTLALAAAMNNSGQVFAYDAEASRLAPIHERLRRAGVRNTQVIAAGDRARLEALQGRMDLVFVDAPCSGSGTWRRHPDAAWRLTERHLAARQEEQDRILDETAPYVAPGGALLFVTCSFLASENEDRVAAFLARHPDFRLTAPLAAAEEAMAERLEPFVDGQALKLSPWTSGTDAFTLHRLVRDNPSREGLEVGESTAK